MVLGSQSLFELLIFVVALTVVHPEGFPQEFECASLSALLAPPSIAVDRAHSRVSGNELECFPVKKPLYLDIHYCESS